MAEVKKFQSAPYFDDFDEKNNFLRVLFRPSYAVQTRELNQLQTILQDQIGIISDFALEDRTRVVGGETRLFNKMPFIKLRSDSSLVGDTDNFIGASFNTADGISGSIVFINYDEAEERFVLYVSYESSASGGVRHTVNDDEDITITDDFGVQQVVKVSQLDSTGNGSALVMNEGIFYIDKSFVRTDKQFILVNEYDTSIDDNDISIGFIVNNTIVKPEMDISLLDNATGAPNETAPGAHRHMATISLINKKDVAEDEISSYIELVRIINGEIAAKPKIDNEFVVLDQILARRTYDQSGDYVVTDFDIDIKEHLNSGSSDGIFSVEEGGDASKLAAKIGAGVGYIRGYEVRPEGISYVDIPKARTTDHANNVILQTQYKNSFICYDVEGIPKVGAKLKLLKNSTTIGHAFIHGASYNGKQNISGIKDTFKVDVKGISFSGDNGWSEVTSITHDDTVSSAVPFIGLVGGYTNDPRESVAVYPLPYGYTQSVNPRVSSFFKELSTISTGATVSLSTANPLETFDDEISSFMVYVDYDGGRIGAPTSVALIDSQNVTIDISGIAGTNTPGNVNAYVIAKVFCTAPAARIKTPVYDFVNTMPSGKALTLTKADVIRLKSVKTAGGDDVTDSFYLDNGCKDTYYDFGKVLLRTGEPLPSGNLTVTYDYFEHSGSGDFFDPSSYASIPYESIPSYTTSFGKDIFLGSAIDYRQRMTSSAGLENVGRTAFVPDVQLISDMTYYMGRQDRIMVTKRGVVTLVQGTPSLTPVLPDEIDDAITLYTINVPPYTFKSSDVTIMKLDHRRFTMRDIGKLENRLSTVEDVALLSSLERDVMDTDFEDRFKSGFVVDNFANGNVIDFDDKDNKIAFDLVNQEIRPMNVSTFIDVAINPVHSSNIQRHANGMTTLKYTTKPIISQSLAATSVRIQPFMVFDYKGSLKLVPASDIWFESQDSINTRTNNAVYYTHGRFNSSASASNSQTGENLFDGAMLAGTWNFVGGIWRDASGTKATSKQAAQLNSLAAKAPTVNTKWGIASQSSTTTITIDSSEVAIPFMREKTVDYTGSGLKPGARVYASFDNVDVTEHVTPRGGVKGGAIYVGGNGKVAGKFTIPGGKFKTGNRIFKLSDSPNPKDEYINTIATFTYTAEGTLKQESASVIRNQRQNIWSDPIAQSFFIEDSTAPGGTFISSIDVAFAPFISNRHTVTIEIRKMVNGYPASEPIYSYAIAEVEPDNIEGSDDATKMTRFTFDSPVYLPSNDEYAFVVLSGSEELALWCSELGKRAYKAGDTHQATGEIISKQPYLGSMFMSQNSTTWSADQMKDIKFVINACEFVSSGKVVYNNKVQDDDKLLSSNIHRRKLLNNPLYFTTGSNTVYVSGWGNGMSIGDTFKLEKSDATGTYFGINKGELFDITHTVTNVDTFGFYFEVTSNATGSGRHGGSNVYCNGWAVDYSYIQLLADDNILESTNVSYSIVSKSKDNFAGQGVRFNSVNPDDIIDTKALYVVKDNSSSLSIDADVYTGLSNLSPIIYEDRIGVNVIANVINSTPIIDNSGNRQEKSSPARYVQKQVSLVTPANELSVIFDANIVPGSSVNVYYKVGQNSTKEQGEWKLMQPSKTITFTSNPSEFYTQRFHQDFESEFQVFSIMIEFISGDKTRTSRVRGYRALALNG